VALLAPRWGDVLGAQSSAERPVPAGATLQVKGLFCPFCQGSIEKNLRSLPAVTEVDADWRTGEVLIEFHGGRSATRAELEDAVRRAGFTAEKVVLEPRSPILRTPEPAPTGPRTIAAPARGMAEERVFSPGPLRRPQALALAPDGTLWIADSQNRRVVKSTSDGQLLATYAPKGLLRPAGIDVSQDGMVAVADFLADKIWLLDTDGKTVGSFGGSGNKPGQFDAPADVLFLDDGTLLVIEFEGARLQHVDRKGKALAVVTGDGTPVGRFTYPTKLQRGADGRIRVSDTYAHRVVTVDDHYLPASAFGKSGRYAGDLQIPGGVAVTDSSLWIADFDNHRVDVLAHDGTLKFVLERADRGALEFERPVDVAVSKDGKTVFVLDWALSQVHRLELQKNL
jgi:DNA-binding beta-propeller fold protein YncE/copper chaperone CopZ